MTPETQAVVTRLLCAQLHLRSTQLFQDTHMHDKLLLTCTQLLPHTTVVHCIAAAV
jgi:hypothetical protein